MDGRLKALEMVTNEDENGKQTMTGRATFVFTGPLEKIRELIPLLTEEALMVKWQPPETYSSWAGSWTKTVVEIETHHTEE